MWVGKGGNKERKAGGGEPHQRSSVVATNGTKIVPKLKGDIGSGTPGGRKGGTRNQKDEWGNWRNKKSAAQLARETGKSERSEA